MLSRVYIGRDLCQWHCAGGRCLRAGGASEERGKQDDYVSNTEHARSLSQHGTILRKGRSNIVAPVVSRHSFRLCPPGAMICT